MNKKTRYISILASNLLIFTMFSGISLLNLIVPFGFTPKIAEAQDFSVFRIPELCNRPGVECGWGELMLLANEILRFAVYLAVLGATFAFAFAGFKMMMNQGNSGEIQKAKGIIYNAAIGLVITMSAWLIVDFILDNMGVRPEFRSLIQ